MFNFYAMVLSGDTNPNHHRRWGKCDWMSRFIGSDGI
jgi:hypothetical protein